MVNLQLNTEALGSDPSVLIVVTAIQAQHLIKSITLMTSYRFHTDNWDVMT